MKTSFFGAHRLAVDAMLQGKVATTALVQARLNTRLLHGDAQPLVIGLSGGGDSVALALMVDEWARPAARPLVFVTIDHGLQPQSRDWTRRCAGLAERLGHCFLARTWTGEKPKTGLPAAARDARHRLLAEVAREVGASVILLGHTADDLMESAAMRQAGATTPDAREWAPSPAWPGGRGLFVLRPMLAIRRSELRDELVQRGETWIEDPANANLAYARARARLSIDLNLESAPVDPPPVALATYASHMAGVIILSRARLRGASAAEAARFVAMASVCAGGGARSPAGSRVARAVDALCGPEPVTATLAGARLEADDQDVRIFREAGEAARGGLASLAMPADAPAVWDGRFEIAASPVGQEVRRLAGLAGRLSPEHREALRALPAAARGGLPARVDADGRVSCLAISGEARSLVADRLAAAAGLIDREPPVASRA